MVPGLDGPDLAQLAGLTSRDIATAMGLRMGREELAQRKHQDLVNEMYQKAIVDKITEETKRLRPSVPHRFADGSIGLVNVSDKLKLETLRISAMGSLEKDIAALEASGKYTPEQVEDYRLSKMGDIGEYEKAVSQGYDKDFATFQKEIGSSRATRISIGEKVETARRTAEEVGNVKSEQKALGPELRKDAIKNIEGQIDFMLAEGDAEKEPLIAAEMEKILIATFGSDKVVRWKLDDGTLGWKVTRRDGTEEFVER